MAVLKVYGSKTSMCTRRVCTVLHELKIPFGLVAVDVMKGEHKRPEYLERHPFGQIPYIDDNGFLLYESHTICRYLATKHPESGLIRTDHKANALFEQAASVELTDFHPTASKIGFEYYKKKLGYPSDPAALQAQAEILDKKLEVYDTILSKQRYVAGDTLTLADLDFFHLPYGPYMQLGSDLLTRRPNVARWYNELVSRPTWSAYEAGPVTTMTY
ncbi:glutathione S-transferase [Mycena rebaudengoi]|nr:glutathione S-transferase [Mycena rebaudengoi]